MAIRMSVKALAINLGLAFTGGVLAHASFQNFFGADRNGGDPVTHCGPEDAMADYILKLSEQFEGAAYHTENGKGTDAYVTYSGGEGTLVAAHYPDGHVCVTLGR